MNDGREQWQQQAAVAPVDLVAREERFFWATFWPTDDAINKRFEDAGRSGSGYHARALFENAEIEVQRFVLGLNERRILRETPSDMALRLLKAFVDQKRRVFRSSRLRLQGHPMVLVLDRLWADAALELGQLAEHDHRWKAVPRSTPESQPGATAKYTNEERRQWMLNCPLREADAAHKLFKQEPRYDGTKQAEWRAEWRDVRASKRGRPPKGRKP
jgi:hypothetical protein